MDAQQFVAEFGHIANAPGGVAKLRELVLSLAFKGELCVQSQSSADELLKIIAHQREKMDAETRIQRVTRNATDARQDTAPYIIPNNWRWVSLSAVGHTWGQKKPSKEFSYIDVSSIDNKAGVLSNEVDVVAAVAAPSRARKIVKLGTLIYSTVRPYLLNVAIIDRELSPEPIASTAFAIVHPWEGVHTRFLYLYLRSPYFIKYVESVQIGMAYPAISDEKFYSGLLPLPPTDEQARIVAKVDELMALCDKLEAQQQARETRKAVLAQALLTRFAEEPTQANLHSLFHSSRAITPADLRKAVLALAVQGKLVPQDLKDESAVVLLKDIAAVKKRLGESGQIKADKKAWVNSSANALNKIPESWSWVRLQDVFEISRGGSPRPAGDPRFFGGSIPWITVGEVTKDSGKYLTATATGLTEEGAERSRFINPGDLLLTNSGATLGVPRISKIRGCINDGVAILRLFHPYDLNEFGYLYLTHQTPAFRSVNQGMGQPNLNTPIIAGWLFPVPPLAEQRRIVSKVDELMALIDKLEAQLANANTIGRRLVETVVSTLTGIATSDEQDLTVKAPPTELISSLHLGRLPDVKQQAPLATELARHQGSMAVRDLWQRFGGDIDAFYAQLKTEVAKGWILEPAVAEMRTKQTTATDA